MEEMNEACKARLKEEYDELVTRINKLNVFLNRNDSGTDVDYGLLKAQFGVMQGYKNILEMRCKRAGIVI